MHIIFHPPVLITDELIVIYNASDNYFLKRLAKAYSNTNSHL